MISPYQPSSPGHENIRFDDFSITVRVLVTNSGTKSGFIESAMVQLEGAEGQMAEAALRIFSPVAKPGSFAIVEMIGRLQGVNDKIVWGRMQSEDRRSVDVRAAWLIMKTIQHDLTEETLEFTLPAGMWEIENLD